MLNKLFTKPVQITISDQELTFHSIADFEFCLSGRTAVPASKIKQLVQLPAQKLRKEAATIKDIEKKFVAILSRSIESPNSINAALRELDINIFSLDHKWRNIIAACNRGGDELNPYRRVALVKYMQYLASRQEIIQYLYSDKQAPAQVVVPSNDANEEDGDRLSGTLLMESGFSDSWNQAKSDEYERLPKGEAVLIQLNQDKEIDINLSKHKCGLSARHGVIFIDQNGQRHTLSKGKNVIGRDASSTIRMDSSLRDISRLHVIIENKGDNILQVTDISSHGTFMSPALFSSHAA